MTTKDLGLMGGANNDRLLLLGKRDSREPGDESECEKKASGGRLGDGEHLRTLGNCGIFRGSSAALTRVPRSQRRLDSIRDRSRFSATHHWC